MTSFAENHATHHVDFMTAHNCAIALCHSTASCMVDLKKSDTLDIANAHERYHHILPNIHFIHNQSLSNFACSLEVAVSHILTRLFNCLLLSVSHLCSWLASIVSFTFFSHVADLTCFLTSESLN